MVGYVVVWRSDDEFSNNFEYYATYDEAKRVRDALNEDCEEGGYAIYKAKFEITRVPNL